MYECDCDDYEYQQSQMEFAGPDDYFYDEMRNMQEYQGNEPIAAYDEDDKELGYSKRVPSTGETIIGRIRQIAKSHSLPKLKQRRYDDFLNKIRKEECICLSLDDIIQLDPWLFVVLAEPLIDEFGFIDWYGNIGDEQLVFLCAHIEDYFSPNSHITERLIITDKINVYNHSEVSAVPGEEKLGYRGYTLRNATTEELAQIANLPNLVCPNWLDSLKHTTSTIEYIFKNYAEKMNQPTRRKYLRYILKNSKKDMTGDGRHFNFGETAWLESLMAIANVSKDYLRNHLEEYVDNIDETLFRNALKNYLGLYD